MKLSSPEFTPGRLSGGLATILRRVAAVLLALAALCTSLTPAHAEPITIDWVTVSDPGNAADTTGYGAVAESYRIGKYEVTIQQYADFLNAAAKSDPYGLYNTSMASDLNIAGISRAGSSGSYTYSVIGSGNRPITYVSWWDAARFANWMQNGQGSGDTENGAYTLYGATWGYTWGVNLGAQFYIPTENQWYKAAYYKGGGTNTGYWKYATQSDSPPGNTIGSEANQANYYDGDYVATQSANYPTGQNSLTDVGAFTASQSAYGTFDQSGNVWEWNDLTGADWPSRGVRGGYFASYAYSLSPEDSNAHYATASENLSLGFRLASPVAVPEPSTWVMGLAGIACAGWGAFRRRKRA